MNINKLKIKYENTCKNGWKIFVKNPSILIFLSDFKFPNNFTVRQKCYHLLYLPNNVEEPKCPTCDKNLQFNASKGYPKHCSCTCRNLNPETQKKYQNTCLEKYGVPYASQSTEFRNRVENTCQTKYGASNVALVPEFKEKGDKTREAKYGNKNVFNIQEIQEKAYQTKVENGLVIPKELQDPFQKYKTKVLYFTEQQYFEHKNTIDPKNIRGRKYNLDHIYSIQQGFLDNIPPEIIGHWTNLQILYHKENSSKNIKCWKTKEQLFEDYKISFL